MKIFFILIFLPFLALVFTAVGAIPFAEKLTMWLWVLLLCSAIGFFLTRFYNMFSQKMLKNYVSRLTTFATRHRKIFVVLFFAIIILHAVLNPIYYFGGDDTRLFYLYPNLFYKNFASKIVTDNSFSNIGNFLPPPAVLSFTLLIWFLKTLLPFGNLQSLLYTINIFGGIFSFYLFLSLFIKNNFSYSKALKIIASVMYVFSIFNFYTLFNSKLIDIFLITIFPLSMYLFISAIEKKRPYYIAILSIILTVFGVVSAALLWFLATLLVIMPLILYRLRNNWKTILTYSLFLSGLLVLLNFHWLIYVFHTTLGDKTTGSANSIVSSDFLNENAQGIHSSVDNNSLLYPLLNLYHRQIQINFNWPYLPIFQTWYMNILYFNVLFILPIFIAGFLNKNKDAISRFYAVSSACFLLGIYFFTVNIGSFKFGNIGITAFTWMVIHIPGFVIFRNMYDKFGHAMAFIYALTLALSLSLLFQYIQSKKVKIAILGTLCIIIFANAFPFLTNRFDTLPIWTTSSMYQGTKEFNHDYQNLVAYLKNQEYEGRYLILPLSSGNVMAIRDESLGNHFYVGVSPLLILSGKNDYSGMLSFGSREKELDTAVRTQDYETTGRIFEEMNVSFIIINKDIPSELQNSYLYPGGLYSIQDDEFKNEFLGKKVRDFGEKYSVYTINPKYKNQKIFLSDESEEMPTNFENVTFKKIASQDFSVDIHSLSHIQQLLFLEDYDSGWKLYLKDGSELAIPIERVSSYPYAMKWELDPSFIQSHVAKENYMVNSDGSLSLPIHIYFSPFRYYYSALAFSGCSFFLIVGYIIWSWQNEKRHKKT